MGDAVARPDTIPRYDSGGGAVVWNQPTIFFICSCVEMQMMGLIHASITLHLHDHKIHKVLRWKGEEVDSRTKHRSGYFELSFTAALGAENRDF
jgi:hypothetical protein